MRAATQDWAELADRLWAATRASACMQAQPADALRLHDLADSIGWLRAALLAPEWASAAHTAQALLELQQALAAAGSQVDPDTRQAIDKLLAAVQAAVAKNSSATRAATRKRSARPTAAAPAITAAADASADAAAPVSGPDDPIQAPAASPPRRARFGATAPRRVNPGQHFVARFLVYGTGDEARVRELLDGIESAAERTRHLGLQSARLDGGFRLHLEPGPGLSPRDGTTLSRDVDWDGTPQAEDFELIAALGAGAGAQGKATLLRFRVEVAGITVASLSLELQCDPGAAASAAAAEAKEAAQAAISLPQKAFASYSSRDRARVLDRVAAIRFFGVDVFVDCLDLAPSEAWKAALEREIAARELFLLFWSDAASKSTWVRWEYQQAMARLQRDCIRIQPLDNGVPPPRALKHLHVADPLNDVRELALARARRHAAASRRGTA